MTWLALTALAVGCLAPELDTPPIDPALLEQQASGGSSGGGGSAATGTACITGTFAGLTLNANTKNLKEDYGYEGQCTINGDVVVDVDSPALAQIAMVKTINGFLRISGSAKPSAVTLLPSLTYAKGVMINGTLLKYVPKLPKLIKTESLSIYNNSQLLSIEGFDAMTDVGTVEIRDNGLLQAINGFGKVNTTSGVVKIHDNHALETFGAFANVSEFGSSVRISHGSVSALQFPKLTRADYVDFSELGILSLSLSALQRVGKLKLYKLTSLKSIGKTQLTQVGGMELHTLPHIQDIAWIPPTAKLLGTANVCFCSDALSLAIDAWIKASGSTSGTLTSKLCK